MKLLKHKKRKDIFLLTVNKKLVYLEKLFEKSKKCMEELFNGGDISGYPPLVKNYNTFLYPKLLKQYINSGDILKLVFPIKFTGNYLRVDYSKFLEGIENYKNYYKIDIYINIRRGIWYKIPFPYYTGFRYEFNSYSKIEAINIYPNAKQNYYSLDVNDLVSFMDEKYIYPIVVRYGISDKLPKFRKIKNGVVIDVNLYK